MMNITWDGRFYAWLTACVMAAALVGGCALRGADPSKVVYCEMGPDNPASRTSEPWLKMIDGQLYKMYSIHCNDRWVIIRYRVAQTDVR